MNRFQPGSTSRRVTVCVNIGLQEDKFKGVTKVQGKFILTWEFPNLLIEVEKEDGAKVMEPRVMSITYTASLSDKGKFYAHLMSWLGRTVSGDELRNFDPAELVGKPCLMQVVHESKDGITRDKVATITPIPDGLTAPAQFNASLIYDYDYVNQVWPAFPEAMPEWMGEKIKVSKQWKVDTSSREHDTVKTGSYAGTKSKGRAGRARVDNYRRR